MKKIYITIDLYSNIRAFSTRKKAEEYLDSQEFKFGYYIKELEIDSLNKKEK